MENGYVYVLTNQKNGTLYIGVTNDLIRRINEHKSKIFEGFTKKYSLDKLVYYEKFTKIEEAIFREKQLKGLLRIKKIKLIESINPLWNDLSNNIE